MAGTREANIINNENAAKPINESNNIHKLTVGRASTVSANGLDSLALLDMGVPRDCTGSWKFKQLDHLNYKPSKHQREHNRQAFRSKVSQMCRTSEGPRSSTAGRPNERRAWCVGKVERELLPSTLFWRPTMDRPGQRVARPKRLARLAVGVGSVANDSSDSPRPSYLRACHPV